jgi:hypothetical protein
MELDANRGGEDPLFIDRRELDLLRAIESSLTHCLPCRDGNYRKTFLNES